MNKEKLKYLEAEISVKLFNETDIVTASNAGTGFDEPLNPEGNRDDGGWT